MSILKTTRCQYSEATPISVPLTLKTSTEQARSLVLESKDSFCDTNDSTNLKAFYLKI